MRRISLIPVKWALWIAFFCLSIPSLQATHIVGGELTYTCLGNDEYLIELTIFRDCFNGSPQAFFDDPAKIAIYNADGDLIDSLFIPFDLMLNDTLDPILSNPCLVVPPDVCVHTTQYAATKTLPVIPGGYSLFYQRCCRNVTINNIVDPLGTGATFGVEISENALNQCNSSAKFKEWPPIYICANEPIDFDQSAIDPDGDSLVYRLCTPFDGAVPADPEPIPSNQTIPAPVIWVDPPYNLGNMLNGSPGGQVLEINPQTGFLTGIPNTPGQFVVGVCLEEYRNGELISTTRRDFQYNVGTCGQAFSSFFAPEVQCTGELSVFFDNQSSDASGFLWDFGDPNSSNDTSTEFSPTYTYSDTGTYTITLIAEPGSQCADTFSHVLSLQIPSLFADFNFEYTECSDTLVVEVLDLTVDTISAPTMWDWVLRNGGITIETSNEQNPTFLITQAGTFFLDLVVTAANGCTQELTQAIVSNVIVEDVGLDTLGICGGESIELNPEFDPDYIYTWAPDLTIDDPTIPNPVANPSMPTTYFVTVTNPGTGCELIREVTVIIPPEEVDVMLPPDTITCADAVMLMNLGTPLAEYSWQLSLMNGQVVSTDSILNVLAGDPLLVYLVGTDRFGCEDIDSVLVEGQGIDVELEFGLGCPGDTILVEAVNLNPEDVIIYDWAPDSALVNMDGANMAWVVVDGQVDLVLQTSNEAGCTQIDSVQLVSGSPISGTLFAERDTIFRGSSTRLVGSGTAISSFTWNNQNTLDDPSSLTPIATPDETTTYTLNLLSNDGCEIQLFVTVVVIDAICEEPFVFLPNAFTPNNDGANDELLVLGNAIEEMWLIIYNRWGTKVFETRDQNESWDGTYEGNELPPDSYGYYLEVRCIGGTELKQQGNINLIR